MRDRLTFLLVAAVLGGCGGNWSNTDLVFANVLPRSAELRSNLPTSSSSAAPLEGAGTRLDGLMVGEASGAWALTRQAAKDYNGMVDNVLGLVEQARSIAPTSRTERSRTWGPFSDSNNPGREVQLVITQKVDERSFEWRVESRAATTEWVSVIIGTFVASGDGVVRNGTGTIQVPVKVFRDVITLDATFQQLDELNVTYANAAWPHVVELTVTARPGATLNLSRLGYRSEAREDGSGSMRFVYTRPDTDVEEVEQTATWKPDSAGRSFGTVTRGTFTGANVTECWDASTRVSYFAESWPGGTVSGVESSCVSF